MFFSSCLTNILNAFLWFQHEMELFSTCNLSFFLLLQKDLFEGKKTVVMTHSSFRTALPWGGVKQSEELHNDIMGHWNKIQITNKP